MSLITGNQVWTGDQQKLVLGRLIKSGAAGSVYHLAESPLQVAKIYHDRIDWREYEHKVAAMLELSPQLTDLVEKGRRYVQIAWPQTLLRDSSGRFVGFAMPAVDVQATSELECILQERQARAEGLPTGLGAKMTLAANLAAVMAELHKQGHHVIDLKPVNLRFYPQSLYMAMLDCDGFSIQSRGGRFAAEQITPEYLAPEFQSSAIAMVGEEPQDCFALAVVVFQLLNFGIHPFSGRPASDRVPTDIPGRIARRCYAYGMHAHPELSPSPVSGHATMPADLRRLFDRAFESAGPARPTAREWTTVLRTYAQRSNQRLMVCIRNNAHQHYAGMACAACLRVALIAATAKSAKEAKIARVAMGLQSQVNLPPVLRPTVRAPRATTTPAAPRPAATRMRPFAASLRMRLLASNSPASSLTTSARPVQSSADRLAVFGACCLCLLIFLLAWIAFSDNENDIRLARLLRPTPGYQPSASNSSPTDRPVATPQSQSPTDLAITHSDIRNVIRSMYSGDSSAWKLSMSGLRNGASKRPAGSRGMYQLVFEKFAAGVAGYSESERIGLMTDLKRIFAQNPDDSETAFELGWLSLLGHDRAGATNWFELALGADPEQAKSWYGMGVATFTDDDAVGAVATADVLIPDAPDAQKMRDAFPPALLLKAGVDPAHFAQSQARGDQLASRFPVQR